MSNNRLIYDDCAYHSKLRTQVGPLYYNLEGSKYENCGKYSCGVNSQNSVDRQFIGKRVGMESELRNQTRLNSRCPTDLYAPCQLGDYSSNEFKKNSVLKPLKYKVGNSTCMKMNPTINPYTCERYVNWRTNLRMPNHRGFDRKDFNAKQYCNNDCQSNKCGML